MNMYMNKNMNKNKQEHSNMIVNLNMDKYLSWEYGWSRMMPWSVVTLEIW